MKFTKLRDWLRRFGPGFVTGVADDDPSGIATYSIAGAQFGYKMSWLTLFLLPAMIAVQEMCGRIGMVSGMGLAGVIKKHRSRQVLWMAVSALLVANVINIGADLGIMAASLQMVAPFAIGDGSSLGGYLWLALVTGAIVFLEVVVPYKKYVRFLKWLGLTLLVYIVTAFLVKQDWPAVISATLIPRIEFNMKYFMTMVGFIGTTISPYLFFWQTSEEVEEAISESKIEDFNTKPLVKGKEIDSMRWDTKMGMFFSSLIAFFIVLTTAATLHVNGIFDIETPQQAALALRPLAGDLAYLLFAFGIIGIGLQSIPVLAGSAAYALSDALGIKEGLSKKFSQAKGFYLVIVVSLLVGMLMNLLGINTIKALYYAAIINGVASVPLIWIIIRLADDPKVVDGFKTQKRNKFFAWTVLVFMIISVLLMLAGIFMQ